MTVIYYYDIYSIETSLVKVLSFKDNTNMHCCLKTILTVLKKKRCVSVYKRY